MRIVLLDSKTLGEDSSLEGLKEAGELIVYKTTDKSQVIERIKNADAVITNKVVIDREVMDASPSLKYIGIAATGMNNVDLKYAEKKGIKVTNVKGYSTNTVVQHTFALLFSVMEHIGYYDSFVKSGDYSDKELFTNIDRPFFELSGKTWGIIGLGEIGRGVASVAEAFGCKVIYYSTSGKNNNNKYTRTELEELLKTSDIVSIHAPLTENTENLINEETLAYMKKTAILINVGRGPIVNETALARALDSHLIAGAGLDVFVKEPMDKKNPLLNLKEKENIVMTPHIAWASEEARKRLIEQVKLNLLQ